jgi:ubiquinone/menaquinone biosynthesis C-methylase UbiE
MLHRFTVNVCRLYQSLFPKGNPEEEQLVKLHSTGQMDLFRDTYFRHELEKGLLALERFRDFSTDWENQSVLDFGCGGGGLTCQLASRFREAWGLDLDRTKLAFAESEAARLGCGNAHFLSYDGGRLPFSDSSFDCVFCVDVVEHLPTPDYYISECLRVLQPGGHLLLSFGPPWRHPHGKHMWSKLPGWWTHLLFPRSVVMEVRGYDPSTTWETIGLHRLTVAAFDSIMRRSGFEQVHVEYRINGCIRPLKSIPFIREFFIGEVVAVFRKPSPSSSRIAAGCSRVTQSA